MSNETPPRRIIIGPLPSGDVMFVGKQDPVAALIAQASAQLDAERAEAEAAARRVIPVNRQWLLNVLRDSIAVAERDLTDAIRAGDYPRRLAAARKRNRLREDFAFCNAKASPT